ncbi:MAG: GGDEF domain-containing protein [Proteobacteria bacterium]|nr:GGDEF domain-containing protein [Pseudomonadota bacterium]
MAKNTESLLKELEFRMVVTTAILSTLDLDYVLYVILSGITSRDGLGFNRAFLLLDDEEGRTLKVRLAVGPRTGEDAQRIWTEIEREEVNFPDLLPRFEAFLQDTVSQALTREMASFSVPRNRLEALAATVFQADGEGEAEGDAPLVGVLARCMLNGTPWCSNALTLRHEVGGTAGRIVELRHVAVVPLAVEGRLIGAIFADNLFTGHSVAAEELRSLHALGNLAALAIDRARLHQRTAAMAEVDGLTGVYNRRYYSAAVDRALESARRSADSVSIILFDLDRFKRCNDQHGHLIGDEVLKDVARILTAGVRGSDVVARYGGEEFIVLLRSTGQEAAVQVAEKLRAKVKESPLAEGQVHGVTLSAGVATTSGEESAHALFDRADRALYRAKLAGRDQVVLATDS